MISIERIALGFASLCRLGKLPVPGTLASVLATLAAPWFFMSATYPVRLLIVALLFIGGGLACQIVEQQEGEQDPSLCVIDEVLGQWIAIGFFCTLNFWGYLAGLVLFRVFDILKPYPIRASEKWLPGGFGVMLDDVLAGVYSAIVLGILLWIF